MVPIGQEAGWATQSACGGEGKNIPPLFVPGMEPQSLNSSKRVIK